MNPLVIAVLVILAGFMIWGYWRGFIRIVFSFATMLLTIVLVAWSTPYITEFLKENTTVYEMLAQECTKKIQQIAEEEISIEGSNPEMDINKNIIPGIQLPQLWIEQIAEKTGVELEEYEEKVNTELEEYEEKVNTELEEYEEKDNVELEEYEEKVNAELEQYIEGTGIYKQVGEYVAERILQGLSFFVAFLLISLLLKLLITVLDIVAKLPLIKGTNRLLGGLAGIVEGLVVIWLLMFLLAIACTSQIGQTALSYVNDSKLLTYLYQNNGIIYFFSYMFG